MNLGYFSHTNLNVSETFIYDLVKDLSVDPDIALTYYSGRSTGEMAFDFKLNAIKTGYSENGEQRSYKAYKVGQILGGGKGFEMKSAVQRKYALKAASKFVSAPLDVAFIEYANSAVLLREFLESKGIPYIVHVHGYDITSSLSDPVYSQQLNLVLSGAKYLIAASHYMKRLLVLLGAKEEKIKVVRIGIDVDSIHPMPWKERVLLPPSVIFLGRLTEKKHPIALLHAFKIVKETIPAAKLTIIGDGPLMNDVVQRIKQLDLTDSVSLLGSLPREKSFPIMNKHWVFAQHSVTARSGDQEGYALSPAEAAAHELPVVSTLHNGIPEHVIEGVTGFLVPEFNFEMMAERIIYLLQNPEIAGKMGKAGRVNIAGINKQELRIATIKSLLKDAMNKK